MHAKSEKILDAVGNIRRTRSLGLPPSTICLMSSAQPMGTQERAKLWLGKLTKLNSNQARPGAACRGKAPHAQQKRKTGLTRLTGLETIRENNPDNPVYPGSNPTINSGLFRPRPSLALSKSAHWMFGCSVRSVTAGTVRWHRTPATLSTSWSTRSNSKNTARSWFGSIPSPVAICNLIRRRSCGQPQNICESIGVNTVAGTHD